MHNPDQLIAAGLRVFPCTLNKTPAIPKGTDWRTIPPEQQHWPAPLIGVIIPEGVLIIDLDTYKGVTREDVNQVLGCSPDWDTALIQTTANGGQHYAFRVDYRIRNTSNVLGLKGFDTRSAGRGYICTGEPQYTSCNGFGMFRVAAPASLPNLPPEARPLLEHAEPTRTASEQPPELDDVIEALRHIDPGRDRAAWVKIGLALRTVTDDVTIFDDWSSGRLADIDPPANYVPEHIPVQWASFKPTGDTRIASLFWEAVSAGWRPSSRVNTAAAFGAVDADLYDRVNESGSDPKKTDELIAAVGRHPVLLAMLARELKDAGLLSKALKQRLDVLAGDTDQPRARGEYGKNHSENATLYLQRHYPEGGLARSDKTWYRYTGKAYDELADDDVSSAVAHDMLSSTPQDSTVSGTVNLLGRLCHQPGVRINEVADNLILYQNGVLDLDSGDLLPHHPGYFTTNILPYDYDPTARAVNWFEFLNSTFEADREKMALLQEWFGYMISNSTRYHKILFMLGPPRSGKGVIGKILEQIVGPHNFSGCELHAFASDSFLDSLRTRTVAFSGDTARSVGRMNADVVIARLKQISGGDAISFDRKYKGAISQALPTRITLAGNNVPYLFDDSGALASRMLVLTFDISYLNNEDHTIFDRCMGELPGISAWALEGLRRLNANNRFTEPTASKVETEFIAESYSPLRQFVKEVCTFGLSPDYKVSCKALYEGYQRWAMANKDQPMSRRMFTSAFKDTTRGTTCRYGVFAIDSASERGFSGLKIDPPEAPTLAPVRAVK